MSADPINQPASKVVRSEARFPAYALKDCVTVAEAIYKKGGGAASPDHLTAFLGYKSSTNGAYLSRIGATRAYGLITKSGSTFVLTPLANRLVTPVYPEDVKKAALEAFFNISLFKQIYEDFQGRALPPEEGLKNALRNNYGVISSRVDVAYRTFMESADFAGFFLTRGSRTHLVIPPSGTNMPAGSGAVDPGDEVDKGGSGDETSNGTGDNPLGKNNPADIGGGGTSNGSKGTPPPGKPVADLDEVKAKYINTLLTLFEQKSANGDVDEKLMERIERLLGVSQS